MKKIPAALVFFLFAASIAWGATITVTQPAGGNVALGSSCPVAWTASGVAGNVKIQLIRPGGALVALLANNLGAGSSPFAWTVAAPAAAGEQYKVRVRAIDGSAEGLSALFTVVQGEAPPLPGSISNVKLSGSSPYCLGTNTTISWAVTGVTQHLKLELLKGGAVSGVIAADMAPGTTSKDWAAAGAVASDYKVRVSASDNSVTAESAAFELKACAAGSGLHAGSFEKVPFKKNSGLHVMAEKVKEMPVWGQPVTVSAMAQNWPGNDVWPNIGNQPLSLFQGRPDCEANSMNQLAHVGVEWFLLGTYPSLPQAAAARLYRSRVYFELGQYNGRGGDLLEAKLQVKQVNSVRVNTDDASCAYSLSLFLTPWTGFNNFDIDLIGSLPHYQAEYSKDITAVVKKWLDGTQANYGLLMMAAELPVGGQYWTCFSCFEVKLVMNFK